MIFDLFLEIEWSFNREVRAGSSVLTREWGLE